MKVFQLGFCACAIFALSACGEGYVIERYTGVPYTDERTAHTGVAYVRAMMAPPAGPVVEPQMMEKTENFGPEVPAALEGTQIPDEEPPVMSAEPMFDHHTKK